MANDIVPDGERILRLPQSNASLKASAIEFADNNADADSPLPLLARKQNNIVFDSTGANISSDDIG